MSRKEHARENRYAWILVLSIMLALGISISAFTAYAQALDCVVSLKVEKDVSNGGPSPHYVKAGDTVVVTLVVEGTAPAINVNRSTSRVLGTQGNWTSETVGSNTRVVGTFTLPNITSGTSSSADLEFEIHFTDSNGDPQKIENGDATCAANGIYVTYLKRLAVDAVTMSSNNLQDSKCVVVGDMLTVPVSFNHTEFVSSEEFKIAGITAVEDPTNSLVPGPNEAYYYFDRANERFEIKYKLPDQGSSNPNLVDDHPVEVVVSARDLAGNAISATSVVSLVANPVRYYGPLKITTQITSGNSNTEDGFWAVKNGETYTVTIQSNHRLRLNRSAFVVLGSPDSTQYFNTVSTATARYIYEAEFTMNTAPLNNIADFTTLLIGYTVYDLAGQDFTFDPATDLASGEKWGRYYAPIEITDIVIESSNSRDATLYAKNEDTITVTFTSNHTVDVTGFIAGKAASITSANVVNSNRVNWTLTYVLQDGDLADLETVPFTFTATDAAENTPVTRTHQSVGVTNEIKYYAPIEATARIKSNNAHSAYAKNGDTVTVTYDAQHETAAVRYRIGSYDFTKPEDFLDSPIELSLTIPSGESSMSEGPVLFWIELLDPAGNTLKLDETSDESQVIYDRTAPEIRFAPAFNGATNQDVYLSIIYSDLYLNLSTVTCLVNDTEQVPEKAKVNGAEPEITYMHQVTITKEGEYYCTGTISDMAGNKSQFAVSCSFIVDKTNPSVSIKLDPNTFTGGFQLNSIFAVEDPLLSEVVCTVTESSGVHEWAIDQPMTVEGRKTVLLVAKDLAGNSSVPITCDIYIDTTAPQPTVRETTRGAVLDSDVENHITVRNGVLGVSLAAIHMGDEKPDVFTRLELLDEDGNIVANLLVDGVSTDGLYYTELPKRGNYTLVMEAEDGVGNKTDAIRYEIVYRPTLWWLIIILCLAGILAAVGAWVYIAKRRREAYATNSK